ncbi:MAG: response regulator [Alphaproteobacteria bacterium]|nr:response regulator [Alphaproteobacteria bacterium]
MLKTMTRFPYARILVVDDSSFERSLISTALKKAGFTSVMLAADGADGLRKTTDFRPDIVLLDLDMPVLNGFGFLEIIRKDKNVPHIPIIVQTAMEDRKSRFRALSCGADDFLTKPLDIDELTLRICVHVERYFMMRDMKNMCDYLRMELDIARDMRTSGMRLVPPTESASDVLENHFEVIEQLACLAAG